VKVSLAGINVPTRVLKHLPEEQKRMATPEVISAAYARISRSEKSIDELLDESIENVARARRSNEAIIYGMGHHSVADHVILNFNLKGVSRLLVESIQRRRLAGYTEKSQRYVTLDGDYVKPTEFSTEDLVKFNDLVKAQNNFYFSARTRLFDFLERKSSNTLNNLKGKSKKEFLDMLEGGAKEDARYSLCLATETQLGCSYTGQTAELAIRELKYCRLEEEREFARLLYEAIAAQAPSIIQLTDPELFRQHNPGQELRDDNFKYGDKNLRELVGQIFNSSIYKLVRAPEKGRKTPVGKSSITQSSFPENDVTLLNHNNPDRQIIAALLQVYSSRPMSDCYALTDKMIDQGRAKKFVRESLQHLSEFDKVPRAFECGFLVYELVVSSSCFAQLKRHRMNTLLSQDYDPGLGYTIPPNIEEVGLKQELLDICDRSSKLCDKFRKRYGKASEYCLTNAHRRRVVVALNIRQLYHISRIREDKSAQWDIREMMRKMSTLAQEVAPFTTMLLGGKHEFSDICEKTKE
jgi:thymidylate synthase ThyX